MVTQALKYDLNWYAVGYVQGNKFYHFCDMGYGIGKLIKMTWILINNMSKKSTFQKNIDKKCKNIKIEIS